MRILEPRFESFNLFILADVEEKLQQDDAILHQVFFKRVDLVIARARRARVGA
jgi:hypothetical protein